ncbi:PfkB family carbohydrate kinase [Syntrophomonas palmitatica]|uniref:PfkB family carbohydrate kinase n=1 Tax=Syntrophomonas palmitatica TaxID=402877 RepID=UPI0006CF42B0|nr:PfkB family carbohydrate kinase [Syntrophomonas palmitatica]
MRLTSREKEIYEVIKKEPLISQEELANRFGITRSSAAVHISNLMKKGIVLGKGYVINEQVSVVVIGESCVDIRVKEDNQGTRIDYDYGGFALEVSRALANFGLNVKVITVTGNDELSGTIIGMLQEKGIDTGSVLRHAERRSCRKLAINGELRYKEGFTVEDYEKATDIREWIVLNCEWLVIEPGMEEIVFRRNPAFEDFMPRLCTMQQITFPEPIPETLSWCSLLVLGAAGPQELDYYSEQAATNLQPGKHLIISDGRSRVVCVNGSGISDFPLLPNQVFDTAERLPFLLAGVLYGLSCGYPTRQSLRIGIGAASGNE